MSAPPKSADAAATDPLVEALDRLERSMAGAPFERRVEAPVPAPVPRPIGAPTGAAPAAAGGGAPSVAATTSPVPPVVVSEVAEPSTVKVANRQAPAGAAPASARAPQQQPAHRRPAPAPELPVRTPGQLPARAPAAREAPIDDEPVVETRGAPAAEAVREDDILPALDHIPEVVPLARRSNRRSPGGGVWLAVWLAGLVPLIVVAVAAGLLWPGLKRGILEEAAQGGRSVADLRARIGDSEGRLAGFTGELDAMRQQLSITPGDAWKELEFLAARNRLFELGDQSIQKADRAAFDKLRGLAIDSTDERLRTGAMSELLRVKFAYVTGIRSASHTIPVGQLFPSLREKSEMSLGVSQLVQVLANPQVRPEYRIKAAYLLADHRSGAAANALASAVATDANLDVVREAGMSFCEMTGYRTDDLFDTEGVARWWKANQARVIAVLGN